MENQIKQFRRGNEDWERFRETIQESNLSKTDLRWLKSIADCYADHGDKELRLAALIISTFATCFKVADSGGGGVLYDGVMSLSTHDDTMSNLLFRIRRELPRELTGLWDEIKTRTELHSPTINKRKKHTPNLMEESFYGKK